MIDRYADTHRLAVTGLYQGKGSDQAPWNPTRIVACLRQLERWTRRALLNRHTRLQCLEGCGIQKVVDAYSNRCKLSCGHLRQTHTLRDDEYKRLVELAEGLKVIRANARVGGWEVTNIEEQV